MKIERKTWPEFFEEVKAGRKKFELRLADFKAKPGDVFVMREWDPEVGEYTGRVLEKEITFVLDTKEMDKIHSKEDLKKFGLVVLSLK